MFGGLGWAETGVLLLLALFVFGPDRLPGLAADAGKALRALRQQLKGWKSDLQAELGPEVGDLDLRSLDPREIVRRNLFADEEPAVPAGRRRSSLVPGQAAPWDPDTT